MIEAVAWAGGVTGTAWAVAYVFIATKRRRVCEYHGAFMSDLASIKTGIMKITAYVADKSTQEGRDLNKEILNSMMKR